MKRVLYFSYMLLTALIAGCTTVHVQNAPIALDTRSSWALLPIVNHTQTPQAGLRAEAILESLVRARGIRNLQKYPTSLNSESLFEPAERAAVDKAMAWASELNANYALTGTVDEWRYKVGVDGEPAVGVTLQLIEMSSGRVIWSAAGSKTGWSREALSAVAQKLLTQLTEPLAAAAIKPNTKAAKRTNKSAANANTKAKATVPTNAIQSANPQADFERRLQPAKRSKPASTSTAEPTRPILRTPG